MLSRILLSLSDIGPRRDRQGVLQRRHIADGSGSRPFSASAMRLSTSAASSSCALANLVQVLVDHMPADPRVAANMAEREVRRQLVEAVGRRLGQRRRIARRHRREQAVGVIIGRRQPFAPDIVDIVEQRLRLRPACQSGGGGGGSGASRLGGRLRTLGQRRRSGRLRGLGAAGTAWRPGRRRRCGADGWADRRRAAAQPLR